MKQKRFVAVVAMMLCLGVLLTGCGKIDSVTKSEFAKVMDTKEYKVEDQSSMIRDDSLKVVYMAVPEKEADADTDASKDESTYAGQHQVEFYEFKDAESCEAAFDKMVDEQKAVYKNASKYSCKEKDVSNGGSVTITTDEILYRIVCADETMVIGISSPDRADEINGIFDALGV